MPAGYDAEVAELFRDLRAASGLSEAELAAQLATRVEVVQALELGAIYALPAWPETCRVVSTYGTLLNLDVRPLLQRIYAQLDAGVVELAPKQPPDVPVMATQEPGGAQPQRNPQPQQRYPGQPQHQPIRQPGPPPPLQRGSQPPPQQARAAQPPNPQPQGPQPQAVPHPRVSPAPQGGAHLQQGTRPQAGLPGQSSKPGPQPQPPRQGQGPQPPRPPQQQAPKPTALPQPSRGQAQPAPAEQAADEILMEAFTGTAPGAKPARAGFNPRALFKAPLLKWGLVALVCSGVLFGLWTWFAGPSSVDKSGPSAQSPAVSSDPDDPRSRKADRLPGPS